MIFLHDYCNRWKLKVNVDKTKVMIFRQGGTLPRNLKFYYNEREIDIVSSFSYLGIVFTTGGAFSQAQETLAGQAQKAIFKLKSYLHKLAQLTPKHTLELFDKLVSPILNYSSEVWGFCQANQIERVHLQFCKNLLGVKQSTQNSFIYGELGRETFQAKRHFSIIKYWLKILNAKENKYINIVYKMMLNDMELYPDMKNWASLVKKLLSSLGFYEVWLNQSVGDKDVFLSHVKQRIHDTYLQNWQSDLNKSSRALFYRTIASFESQFYLDAVTVKKWRVALSRLRVSSHRLGIETGRWGRNRVAITQRKCQLCNILEDEYHFIFECPAYNEIRNQYISRYYRIRPNMHKCTELLMTKSKSKIRNLACYIYKAFEIRNSIVYNH